MCTSICDKVELSRAYRDNDNLYIILGTDFKRMAELNVVSSEDNQKE